MSGTQLSPSSRVKLASRYPIQSLSGNHTLRHPVCRFTASRTLRFQAHKSIHATFYRFPQGWWPHLTAPRSLSTVLPARAGLMEEVPLQTGTPFPDEQQIRLHRSRCGRRKAKFLLDRNFPWLVRP